MTPDSIYSIYLGIALFFVGCGYLAFWLVRHRRHLVWGQWAALLAIAAGLLIWGAQETGEYAGMGQTLILAFIWTPAVGCTAVGAAVGLWLRNVRPLD